MALAWTSASGRKLCIPARPPARMPGVSRRPQPESRSSLQDAVLDVDNASRVEVAGNLPYTAQYPAFPDARRCWVKEHIHIIAAMPATTEMMMGIDAGVSGTWGNAERG